MLTLLNHEELDMPNCFTLTKKGEDKPSTFQDIDQELCDMLGVPCDDEHWVEHWYDSIGLALACGKTFKQMMQEDYWDINDQKILKYLDEHYTSSAWAEVGGRR